MNLPLHSQEGVVRGGFDHGDVHKSSGRVFVAHCIILSQEDEKMVMTELGYNHWVIESTDMN